MNKVTANKLLKDAVFRRPTFSTTDWLATTSATDCLAGLEPPGDPAGLESPDDPTESAE